MAQTITADAAELQPYTPPTITADESELQPHTPTQPALPDAATIARIADANAKMTVEALTRPMPVPIPGRLDNVTPDPRGLLQRTGSSYLDSAAGIVGGATDVARGSVYDRYPKELNLPSSERAVTSGAKHISQSLGPVLNTAIGAGLATAPAQTLVGLAGADALQKGTTSALTAGGMDPDKASLLGDVAGLIGGGAAHTGFERTSGAFDRFMTSKLDAANKTAAKGVDLERMQGTESAADVLGGESIPIQLEGKAAEIRPGGQSAKGRPFFTIVDPETGKPIYGGYGDKVQEFLRSRGAKPVGEAASAPIDEAQVARVEQPAAAKEIENVRESEPAQPGRETPAVPEVQPEQVARVEAAAAGEERTNSGPEQSQQQQAPEVVPLPAKAATAQNPQPDSTAQPKSKEQAVEGTSASPRDHTATTSPIQLERRPESPARGASNADTLDPAAVDQASNQSPQPQSRSELPSLENSAASADEQHARVLNALRADGRLTNSAALQRSLPDIPREQLGQVLQDLENDKQVILHRHSTPLAGLEDRQDELQSLIPHPDGKMGIVGVAPRRAEMVEPPRLASNDQPGLPQTTRGQVGEGQLRPDQQAVSVQPQANTTLQSARKQAPSESLPSPEQPRAGTAPAYGRETAIAVPGEQTSYPARYAIREAADVFPSHNPESFEANPAYEHRNDRDYSQANNAARVVNNSAPGKFSPDYTLTESPTAEHGAPVIDQRGNALGGNNRTMAIQRVYARNDEDAKQYRIQLRAKAHQFGIDRSQVARFTNPVLVRERTGAVDAQREITDYNKTAAAALSPSEQAIADGRRLSAKALKAITGNLADAGEDSTLAQALRGDDGAQVLNALVRDGVLTEQEKNGYVDERGQLTADAKDRIGKMIVGRLFESPSEYSATSPELRNKLERVAPQVLRVEGRGDWAITPHVREAVGLLRDAQARKIRNLEDLAKQTTLDGEPRKISAEAFAIAKTLQQGPLAAQRAFRQYANDETLSREGAQSVMFDPPTQSEAFEQAFRNRGERGAATVGALTLGLDKFVAEDIAPTVKEVASTILDTSDDILKILAPAARGRDAKTAALIMRKRLAELARRSDQAQASLAKAKKFFDGRSAQDNYDFINRIESGQAQATPDLDAIAQVFRTMMDQRRAEVQALGKGKLQRFYENYFPHIWKDPKKAGKEFMSFFTRRPLEGGKSFLKERTHITFADGLAAGLQPVSDNPVDLVILKSREMDRYLMAHRVLDDWKSQKLAKFIDARNGKAPAGWKKIDDPIGTVYGASVQDIAEYPNEGLYDALEQTAAAIGVRHTRSFNLGRRRVLGFTREDSDEVVTRHGTAEDILAHEIGHQLEFKYDLFGALMQHGATQQTLPGVATAKANTKTRVKINKELRDLADLRNAPPGYRRNRDEKMAAIVQAWIGAREAFERTAPAVFAAWKDFLQAHPELKPLLEAEGSMNHKAIAQPYDVGGLVIKGHWWAPEGAARILNNYLMPGLRQKSGVYRAVLGLNNVINQFQLGLSAFHLGFTSADAAVSKAALGFENLMRGKPVGALKAFAGVPLSPLTNAIEGNKLLKEWMQPGSQGGQIAAIVDGLVSAGGRAHMDEFYQTNIAEKMRQAWRHGNWFGALLRAPFAGVEQLSNVIMSQIVPRQKLGVFADLARFEMERLGPGATAGEVQAALAKVWDSVENRMGQMTYDNLFWDRTAKDIAMIAVRSVGWNLGTIREIGGGAIDAVKLPVQLAGGFGGKPGINAHRMAYLAGLVTVSAIMGALYQYLATGKGPQELKDYFFPRSGELDEAGRPQRMSMPTYVKDVYHYGTEPGKTLANKVAPIWSLFGEMIHNKDFYGTEIRNADDPLVTQMKDLAMHVGKGAVPFGIRNMQRQSKLGAKPSQLWQSEIGITPAPAALEKTRAELLASELANAARPVGTRTKEETARRDAINTIARLARAGKPFSDEAKDALAKGTITRQDVHNALMRAKQKPLTAQFSHASLPDALKVWEVATSDERRELRPLLLKKAHALKNEPPELQLTLTPKVRAALAK